MIFGSILIISRFCKKRKKLSLYCGFNTMIVNIRPTWQCLPSSNSWVSSILRRSSRRPIIIAWWYLDRKVIDEYKFVLSQIARQFVFVEKIRWNLRCYLRMIFEMKYCRLLSHYTEWFTALICIKISANFVVVGPMLTNKMHQ